MGSPFIDPEVSSRRMQGQRGSGFSANSAPPKGTWSKVVPTSASTLVVPDRGIIRGERPSHSTRNVTAINRLCLSLAGSKVPVNASALAARNAATKRAVQNTQIGHAGTEMRGRKRGDRRDVPRFAAHQSQNARSTQRLCPFVK